MKLIECYTDGSCPRQHGDGGWAFAIVDKDDADKSILASGYLVAPVTNQVAELEAAGFLMIRLRELGLTQETIHVFSDSRYLVDGMEQWRHVWCLHWDDEKIKNRDVWKGLHDLAVTFKRIRFRWVKGHAGNKWNNKCDAMAVAARKYGARNNG